MTRYEERLDRRTARRRIPFLALLLSLAAAGSLHGQPLIEVGADDFRVSVMGSDGDPTFDAIYPAIAYNAQDREYLVVWYGDASSGEDDEMEIFGRLLDAEGAPLGADFRISHMGPDGDGAYDAYEPDVVYNPQRQEYLVVWHGDDDGGALVDNEYEIWARRITAAGTPFGPPLRISDVGGSGDPSYGAYRPRVAHNPYNDEYVVVWFGDDFENGQVDDEFEIFAQRLSGTGSQLGTNDLVVSMVDGLGSATTGASEPDITWDEVNDYYCVVWQADAASFGLADNEFEVFARRLNFAALPLSPALRVSDTPPALDPSRQAFRPRVAVDVETSRYLIAWEADGGEGLADDEFEIFGRTLTPWLAQVAGPFRISEVHGTGDPGFDASRVDIGLDPFRGRFVTVWHGDALIDEEFEVWGRLVRVDGTLDGDAMPLSAAGGFGQPTPYVAGYPAIAFDSEGDRSALVVWHGDRDDGTTADDEYEIWGQRFRLWLFGDGFESGDMSQWSSAFP